MTKMVRKQLYIASEHEEKLKKLAADLGITEAEVMRRAIGGLHLAGESIESRELRAALETLARLAQRKGPATADFGHSRADIYRDYPRRTDPQAWADELAFIEERARLLPEGGSTEKWHREDSYDDERQTRLPR